MADHSPEGYTLLDLIQVGPRRHDAFRALRVRMLSAPGLVAKSLREIDQLVAAASLDIARREIATS